MIIKKNGNRHIKTTEENLEYRPIEMHLGKDKTKHIEYGVDLFLARKQSTVREEIYTNDKPAPVSTSVKEVTGSWLIVSQKEIDNYLNGQELVSFSLENDFNKKFRGHLALCKESEVQVAEDKKRVTFYDDVREYAPFVSIDTNENIKSGEPLRLVEVYDYDMSMYLRTTKDTYLSRPIFTEISSRDWDLNGLLKHLKEQENWKFIVIDERGRRPQLVEKNNEKALSNAISYVPYYNQNEEGDLKEMMGVFIPNAEHIKTMLSQSKSQYQWAKDFYTGSSTDDVNNMYFYNKNNIVAYCLDGYSHSLEYKEHVNNKNELHGKKTP